MVARRTVVFRLYCALQLYTTVSSALGMTKYCDSTDVSEDESTDYPESEHSDFTELQSSGISEDGSTDHPFSEYSETECSDFEDDVSIISHTDVDSDCWDDEKSITSVLAMKSPVTEEQGQADDATSPVISTPLIETPVSEEQEQSKESSCPVISTPLIESLPEEALTGADSDVSAPERTLLCSSNDDSFVESLLEGHENTWHHNFSTEESTTEYQSTNSPYAAQNEQQYEVESFSPINDVFSSCVNYEEFDFSTFINEDPVTECPTESSGAYDGQYPLEFAIPVIRDRQMSVYVPPSPPLEDSLYKKRKQVEYTVNHSKRFKTENVEHYCVMYEGQPNLSSNLHRGVLYSEKLSKVFSSRCLFCQISKKACNSSPGNGKCDRCMNKSSQGEELCCIFNMKFYRKA